MLLYIVFKAIVCLFQEPEIVVQPDMRLLSPTDKEEFLLPQSLSEALTMEMKQTDRRKSGEYSPKLSGSPKTLGKFPSVTIFVNICTEQMV